MAYNYEYPYTDPNRFNVDWLLNEMKRLGGEFVEFVKLNKIKYANPIEWDITHQYEKNTVVIDDLTGNAYLSVDNVPKGVSLNNTDYWTPIFNYSAVLDGIKKEICTDEGTSATATESRSVGDLVWLNDNIVRIIAPMIAGDTYVLDSNCVDTTIEQEIKTLLTAVTNLTVSVDDHENRLDTIEPIVAQNTEDIEDLEERFGERLDTLEPIVAQHTVDINDLKEAIVFAGNFVTPEQYGAVGDGVTDDTTAFNNAVSTGKPVFLANKYLITSRISPQNFLFGNGTAEVRKSPTVDDRLFNISKAGIVLSNFTVVGNRKTRTGTFSEYGHGVAIEADNVTLDNLTIKDTGGDGIYIGGNTETFWNRPRVLNCTIDNAGRNCISVISCQYGEISGCYLAHATHQAPMCGIDLEPNLSTQRITISITNNTIYGCDECGIRYMGTSAVDGSVPFDIQCDNNRIIFCSQVGGQGRADLSYPIHIAERGNGYRTDIALRNTYIYGEPRYWACYCEFLSDVSPRVLIDVHCVRGGSNKYAIKCQCKNHSGGTTLQYISDLKFKVRTDITYTHALDLRNYQAGQNRVFEVELDADKNYTETDMERANIVYYNTPKSSPTIAFGVSAQGVLLTPSLTGVTVSRSSTGTYNITFPPQYSKFVYTMTCQTGGCIASVSSASGNNITVKTYNVASSPTLVDCAFKVILYCSMQ